MDDYCTLPIIIYLGTIYSISEAQKINVVLKNHLGWRYQVSLLQIKNFKHKRKFKKKSKNKEKNKYYILDNFTNINNTFNNGFTCSMLYWRFVYNLFLFFSFSLIKNSSIYFWLFFFKKKTEIRTSKIISSGQNWKISSRWRLYLLWKKHSWVRAPYEAFDKFI